MTTTTPTYPNRSRLSNTVSKFAVAILLIVVLAGSAQALTYTFDDSLSGRQEVSPNLSTGLGQILGTYDDVSNTFDFELYFTGLSSPTVAAHLHSPASPGVNAAVQIGFTGFPLGVTTGFFENTYIFTAAQETDLLAGLMYVNIHTSAFPGGEIRGQITARQTGGTPPTGVPDHAGTGVLLGLGLIGLVAFARRSNFPRTTSAG